MTPTKLMIREYNEPPYTQKNNIKTAQDVI